VTADVFMPTSADPVLRDTLSDDGTGLDILPRDGVFSGPVAGTALPAVPGLYRVLFTARAADGSAADTLSAAFRAVSGGPAGPPVLRIVEVPDTLAESGLDSVLLSVFVSDPDGVHTVDSVTCDVVPPGAPVPSVHLALAPSPSDGGANYSARFDLTAACAASGSYTFRFQARDASGLVSAARTATVLLLRPNGPPVLVEASPSQTVSRRLTEPILLFARVEDPQGPSDVLRVGFNTTKPNGQPSAGNPFAMADDGTNGDENAGDGVYSLAIVISASNDLGEYRFEFFAEDRQGAASPPLVRIITVVE
jgi:hypothetical protein